MTQATRPPEVLSVTYTNTRRDLVRLLCWTLFGARRTQIALVLMWSVTGLAVFAMIGFTPAGLAVVAAGVLAPLLIVGLLVAVSVMPSARTRGVLTTHRVTLTPTGVVEETTFNRGEVYWAAVHRIVESSGYLYIFPSELTVHMIPAAAFADLKERQAFGAHARRCMEQARTGTGP